MRNAIESEKFKSSQAMRASVVDPYLGFVQHILVQHPRLRASRISLQLQAFDGEEGAVESARFGSVMGGPR